MDIVRRGLAASPDSKRERLTRLVNLYCNWQGKYNDTLPKALMKHDANRLSRTAHRYYRYLKDVLHATGWTETKTLAAFHKVVGEVQPNGWPTDSGRNWTGGYRDEADMEMVTRNGFLEMLRFGRIDPEWWTIFYDTILSLEGAPDPKLKVYTVVVKFVDSGDLNSQELQTFSHTMLARRWAYRTNSGEHFFCEGLMNKAKLIIANMEWHNRDGELVFPSPDSPPGSAQGS